MNKVGRNKRGTEHYSVPQEARIRKKYQFTLSDEARARLEELAEERGEALSEVVEDLILQARR